MNEVISTILARKGTKEYDKRPVEREKLELLLRCAAAAPNAYNAQKWRFACVTETKLLCELEENCYRALVKSGVCSEASPYAPFYGAPAVLVFSAAKENEFRKQDCSAALQNAAVAAKSLGLGSRFLDVPNEYFHSEQSRAARERLCIPDDYETVCFLSVGYPANEKEQPTEKRSDLFTFVD